MRKRSRQVSIPAIVLGMGVLVSACQADARHGFKAQQRDRESYSLGYQTGQNLKTQQVDVDLEVYLAAVRDALAGREPELSKEEMRAALNDMGNRIKATLQAESKAKAGKNLEEGREFLEANKKKEGVHVLPSGLQYRILKQGTGMMPGPGDAVMVNYRGTLPNGTEFASSYKQNKPWSARVNQVIPGWQEALPLMKEGSQWQLFIPPELAYGPKGTAGVEPNSTLIFDVELISVTLASAKGGDLKPIAAHK